MRVGGGTLGGGGCKEEEAHYERERGGEIK